jgi:hypothetical protein
LARLGLQGDIVLLDANGSASQLHWPQQNRKHANGVEKVQ